MRQVTLHTVGVRAEGDDAYVCTAFGTGRPDLMPVHPQAAPESGTLELGAIHSARAPSAGGISLSRDRDQVRPNAAPRP